ncbi:Hypothetical_protein [Hexamita inflata]|uniref:Hypothetical_protein n=1 Tax=Hexamita inflata TaxID=28002 RepID=A0AA86R2U2_9EUKA|nr:Hypothetical protein HINF_LOCUS52553 [Hexamita inflata]
MRILGLLALYDVRIRVKDELSRKYQASRTLISSKPINLEHFSGCLQHGKLLSTMFGGTFYCVIGDLLIKAKDKKTDSIWENPVRKQSSLKVVVWNKLSLIVTTQATMSSTNSIFQGQTQIALFLLDLLKDFGLYKIIKYFCSITR